MRKLFIVLAALGVAATPALAQEMNTEGTVTADFATIDADASGAVSFEELATILPDLTEDQFSGADADGSGDLNEEELNAYLESQATMGAGS